MPNKRIHILLTLLLLATASYGQQLITLNPGASIQSAINNAPDRSIIQLNEGTYQGGIILYRGISIIGIGATPAVIKGGGRNQTVTVIGNQSSLEFLNITQDSTANNDLDAYPSKMGVLLEGGSSHNIRNCIISNHVTAIYVSSSTGNTIQQNRFRKVRNGVLLAGFSNNSDNNTVRDNSFETLTSATANDGASIRAITNYRGNNNLVNNNNFNQSAGLAANNQTGNTLNAQQNWWGHPSGPTHSGNANGQGLAVSDFIDYGGFLTAAANIGGNTGTLQTPSRLLPGDTLTVSLSDTDLNRDPSLLESFQLIATNMQNNEEERITLLETGINTGTFQGSVNTALGTAAVNNNGLFEVQIGQTILITYQDIFTNTGETATTSKSTRIVSDLLPPVYSIQSNAQVPCANDSFSISIIADSTLSNVLGLDFTLQFDSALMIPTGNIIIGNTQVIDPSLVEAVNFINGNEINLSLFIGSNAPSNTAFAGTGEVCRIVFRSKGALSFGQQTEVVGLTATESYLVSTKEVGIEPVSITGGGLSARLLTWAGLNPMAYDNTGTYLKTSVLLADANCINPQGDTLTADGQGVFQLPAGVTSDSRLSLMRDISPTTQVMPAINGIDAQLAQRIVVEDATFIPEPWQIIAADVNQDGVVSAGDITQIIRRTVGISGEFAQAWNYDDEGNSNGQPSRDWVWLSREQAAQYSLSSTFPQNDGTGVSRTNIPSLDYCSDFSKISCDTADIYGLLLGDTDGSIADTLANSNMRLKSEGFIELLLTEASEDFTNGTIDIPFNIIQEGDLVAMDANFAPANGLFDAVALSLEDEVISEQNIVNERDLLFTSFSLSPYTAMKGVLTIRSTEGVLLDNSSFENTALYLNGKRSPITVEGSHIVLNPLALNDELLKNTVAVFPNPANHQVSVKMTNHLTGQLTVEVIDVLGRIQSIQTVSKKSKALTSTLNIDHLRAGAYIIVIKIDGRQMSQSLLKN